MSAPNKGIIRNGGESIKYQGFGSHQHHLCLTARSSEIHNNNLQVTVSNEDI